MKKSIVLKRKQRFMRLIGNDNTCHAIERNFPDGQKHFRPINLSTKTLP